MLIILLAGVGLALALGVYLLFRQLRQLSWQLTLLRVEHDSDRILHAIGVLPNDTWQQPGPAQPVRRKRHLGLYIGGGAAALLTFGRELRAHPSAAIGSAAAVVVAAAVTAALFAAPGQRERAEHPAPPALPAPTADKTSGPSAVLPPPTTDGSPSTQQLSEAAGPPNRITVKSVIRAPSTSPSAAETRAPSQAPGPTNPPATATAPSVSLTPPLTAPPTQLQSWCLRLTLAPVLRSEACLLPHP